MKKLGVIGGLGPLATAYFTELITKMTLAGCDQEHLEAVIYSRPSIPDRTAYILGKSNLSPLPMMTETAKILEGLGCTCIAVPCITSHCYYDELQNSVGIPVINIVRETASLLKKQNISCAGIMATSGTISTQLFQKELSAQGIEFRIPDEKHQNYVMEIIYDNVKAGIPVDLEKFRLISRYLFDSGAEVIILGCTELSLVKRDYHIGKGYVDAMEALARRAVISCDKKLRKEFENIIT